MKLMEAGGDEGHLKTAQHMCLPMLSSKSEILHTPALGAVLLEKKGS